MGAGNDFIEKPVYSSNEFISEVRYRLQQLHFWFAAKLIPLNSVPFELQPCGKNPNKP